MAGLARCISKLGFASRTDAARLIRAGRVSVGGVVVRDPERRTDPAREAIALDGRPLAARERLYYAMHKPAGPVTTWSDPEGRETVYALLPEFDAWIFPVGRLDAETSGLLLFTNDAGFADAIAGDRSSVEKRYEVTARAPLPDAALEALRGGVEIAREDGSRYRTRPAAVERLGPARLAIAISEGKNRQVRRMIAAVGGAVARLHRTRIGPLDLGDLPEGATRVLSRAEVDALRAAAKNKAAPRTDRRPGCGPFRR
ncbi:MAG TPA: pseudouridine synthase [Planctomycetota bacterium]|nr:pseudouridine synthase [Planctomycetota bacterium]